MPSIRIKLLTGRSLDQGKTKWQGKFSDEFLQGVAVCMLHPEDMKRIGISDGENIRVAIADRSVILKAQKTRQESVTGTAFIPYGPWANYIISDVKTQGTGMPSFKGLDAEVSPAPAERVLGLEELVKRITGDG
ncbi:MAG: molybdopterin dinucleotide-binding protein [Nitrososphaeria archaeon]|nr:molybdopterin dinucleotide-binding protein [Nitrososphaeria archaeon]NIN51607.1 molybdopterin dinucleotide-binding protein [Nitrososphaeria archaeon]NIQ32092.1 molybdopterin dinucleotide-binding protein [Nitrososphaeria archaeon]